MTPAPLPFMPTVQYFDSGGVRLAYYEAGPRAGVPVVLCHGFPELAFSWRHQIAALAAAGFWVIAPDQRGYGLSDSPAPVEAFDLASLMGDLAALLDHVGAPRAVFCGHDWGGIIVWQMPLYHPNRVAGVIGVNTPFTPRAKADPIEILRRRFGEDMYIVHFQTPDEAERVLEADPERTFAFFLKRPAPGEGAGGGLAASQARDADGIGPFALIKRLERYDPAADPREGFLTDEEMRVFVETFRRGGFRGPVNWYRNFSRNWRAAEGVEDKVAAPCLMIMAEKDAVLPPSAADGLEAFAPDLEKRLITDCGHWTQQERPDAVNAALIDWLSRRIAV
jgi:pimeloyl-ACP methyl ester carboxylesterase